MNQKIKGTYAMQLNHSDFAVTLKITLALYKMTTNKKQNKTKTQNREAYATPGSGQFP